MKKLTAFVYSTKLNSTIDVWVCVVNARNGGLEPLTGYGSDSHMKRKFDLTIAVHEEIIGGLLHAPVHVCCWVQDLKSSSWDP